MKDKLFKCKNLKTTKYYLKKINKNEKLIKKINKAINKNNKILNDLIQSE